MVKICSKCGVPKPLGSLEFYRNVDSKDGYRSDCKACCRVDVMGPRMAQQEDKRAYMRSYNVVNADNLRHAYLLRNYGISLERYVEMFDAQEGRCSICQRTQAKALAVDHDHACCPGKRSCGRCVRGLLCSRCNVALGNFQDDPSIMERAIAYVTAAGLS